MKELSTIEITNEALLKLKLSGARVRRVNNIPHNKRYRHQVELGWPDIQGYTSRGVVLLCEVKKKGDTMKTEQVERLRDCTNCGGVAIVATQIDAGVKLFDFTDYLIFNK